MKILHSSFCLFRDKESPALLVTVCRKTFKIAVVFFAFIAGIWCNICMFNA